MQIHGALLPFTQHGLEEYNDCMTKDYFRSSSHRGQECLIQIMQKQNSIEHLEHSGAKQTKQFSVTCSNCGKQEHNRLTCSDHARCVSTHLFVLTWLSMVRRCLNVNHSSSFVLHNPMHYIAPYPLFTNFQSFIVFFL